MTLIEQLELLAKTQPTPFDVHWADEARRLATWAAVTLVASNSALEAEQRRVSELEALLREAYDIATGRVQTPRIIESVVARIDAALGRKD